MQNIGRKDIFALILAGGVGSRFWPFSRELEPKQFMHITGKQSLFQDTCLRLKGLVGPGQTYIISNKAYFYELKKQSAQFAIPEENILLEPEGKNTAPAIGLAARLIAQIDKEALLLVLPSDHYVGEVKKFQSDLLSAIAAANDNYLVTLGVRPKRVSSAYGYIKIDRASLRDTGKKHYLVKEFLEKPNLAKAKRYFKDRDYFWNSGMFVWKVSVFFAELKKHLPALYHKLMQVQSVQDAEKIWHKIKPISIDYGLLEHSRNIALISAKFKWADLGSWDALSEVLQKDKSNNVIRADVIDVDSKGICVFSRSHRLIATIGLEDVIIADTPDALLVCKRDKTQEVKKIAVSLKSRHRQEYIRHISEKRPWGRFIVLQRGDNFKIKLVEIEPQKRLSLQSHTRRAEHWVVVSGLAKITKGHKVKFVYPNQSIYIPKGMCHRLENPGNKILKIVEVQTGNYIEEDDIKRFNDDFKR